MLGNGEPQKEVIRPDFNKSIFIDFAGAGPLSALGGPGGLFPRTTIPGGGCKKGDQSGPQKEGEQGYEVVGVQGHRLKTQDHRLNLALNPGSYMTGPRHRTQ